MHFLEEIKLLNINEDVFSAISMVPRDMFIPNELQAQATYNKALPIGEGQSISQPSIVALMTQELGLNKNMRVLEIGTGSGYQTAILGLLSGHVYTVERIEDLQLQAKERLNSLGISNIAYKFGDGNEGWKEEAPFERIIVTAASQHIPSLLMDQLAVGGIMILPLHKQDTEYDELMKITKPADGDIRLERLLNVCFVPLVSGTKKK